MNTIKANIGFGSKVISNSKHKQQLKTWKFATHWLLKKSTIDLIHKDNKEQHDLHMKDFGKWTKNNLTDLGPTFIKLGQIASCREDIFSEVFVKELSQLQDDCNPIQDVDVIELVEKELGTSIDTVFSNFDTKPFKAASIGQVHLCTLKNGLDVVLKIKRPNIERDIVDDLKTIQNILNVMNFFHFINSSDITIVDQSKKYLLEEVDYINEYRNIKIFSSTFNNDSNIVIPRIYSKYKSKSMLIMERVDGVKITEIKRKSDRKLAVKLLIECFLIQIIDHGIIHSDPHSGNIAYKNQSLILYDFGFVIDISSIVKESFSDILRCLLNKDSRNLVDILLNAKLIIPLASKQDIVYFFESIFQIVQPNDIDTNLNMLELMQDLGYSDTNRPFSVSNDLIFIGKSITVIDGICKTLDTDYAPEDIVKSFLEQRIDIFDLVLDNSFSDLIEMPKKIQQMNQSIFLIDKTTSVLNAKTIALKRQTLQSKLAMGVVIVLQLILICQSL